MSLYFRGHSGVTWNEYGPGTGQVPNMYIPYPAGIQVGDLLIAASYHSIQEGSIYLGHWTPMSPYSGYLEPSPHSHFAYWAIADAADVAAGQLHVLSSTSLDEYYKHYNSCTMMAWKPRSDMSSWSYVFRNKFTLTSPFPARSSTDSDLSIGIALGGTGFAPESSPYQPPVFGWGAYTEEYQIGSSQYEDFTSTLAGIPTFGWESVSYGASYYEVTSGSIPSTQFTATSSDDPAGGDGQFIQSVHLGYTEQPVGYWGILMAPL